MSGSGDWLRPVIAAVRVSGVGVALQTVVRISAVLPLCCVVAQPEATQKSSVAKDPAIRCEMHVWPAATTHTTFQGWVRAGAVDGARRGVKGYPDFDAGALDAMDQARLLSTVDWQNAIGDPQVAVIVHPGPTGSEDDRGRVSRLITDSAPCYRELIITSSIIESAVFASRSVRILAISKRYDGATAAPVNFSSMSVANISVPDDDRSMGASEHMKTAVQAAFVAAVRKFAVMQSTH